MKKIELKVKEDNELIKYLIANTAYSKNKIKTLLKYKKIFVNNKCIIKLPYKVNINDIISIDLNVKKDIPFKIIYEDKEILIVYKEAGLLTISNTEEKEKTLYHLVKKYANDNKYKVYIINRLDRDTSGMVMFAKNEQIKLLYQNKWNELVSKRGYIAVVEGKINRKGKISNLLYEEKNTIVHSSKIGKKAITNYELIKNNDKYSLVDIHINTGRKNQIRVHFSEMGNPIVGDKKYGSRYNPINRMCLHNYELEFKHPITNELFYFKCDIPDIFYKIV